MHPSVSNCNGLSSISVISLVFELSLQIARHVMKVEGFSRSLPRFGQHRISNYHKNGVADVLWFDFVSVASFHVKSILVVLSGATTDNV